MLKTKLFATAAVATLLSACGGGGSPAPMPTQGPSPVPPTSSSKTANFDGAVVAGLAACELSLQDATGAPLAMSSSGADGMFGFSLDIDADADVPQGMARLSATNCTYEDEATGRTQTGASLSALFAMPQPFDGSTTTLALTPITRIVDESLTSDTDGTPGATTAAALMGALDMVAAQMLDMDGASLLATVPSVSVDTASADATDAERSYGLALAALSGAGDLDKVVADVLESSPDLAAGGGLGETARAIILDGAGKFELSGRNVSGQAATVALNPLMGKPSEANRSPIVAETTAFVFDVPQDGTRTVSVDLSTIFNDPDGDALVFRTFGLPSGWASNGTMLSGSLASDDRLIFIATAYDKRGGGAAALVTVSGKVKDAPANTAPVAADDSVTLSSTLAVRTVDVLANDTDADNDTLSVTAVSDVGAGIKASVVDGKVRVTGVRAGTWSITYTVSDGRGGSDTARVSVVVPELPNTPPVASIAGGDRAGVTPFQFTMDGSGSSDADGEIVSWAWDFGDTVTGTGATINHGYIFAGTYTITLTVTDDRGATATDTVVYTATEPENQAPTARINGSDRAGEAPLKAYFSADQSTDSDGTIASYLWEFGNGDTSTAEAINYTYTEAGTYTVKLTVTDDDGATATATQNVKVMEPEPEPEEENKPPVAVLAGIEADVEAPYTFTADASGSSDPDGTIASYAWDFGDSVTKTGRTAVHSYIFPGTYTVTLTVTDDDGATSRTTTVVKVTEPEEENKPPIAAIAGIETDVETPYYFTADASGSSDSDGTIASYAWDFGDSVTKTGQTAKHGYIYPGTYTVTLTVTDDDGATARTTTTVKVTKPAEADINMFQIISNLNVDTVDDVLSKVDRAKASGANTVFFSDTKVTNYGLGQLYNTGWERRATEVFQGIKDRDMDLVLNTINMGYCNTMASDDVSLATGYPIVDQPMVARGGKLVPVDTARNIADPGFETTTGNRFDSFFLQDEPGERTFVDTNVKRSGNSSLRMEAFGNTRTRAALQFTLEPETQYSLNFWIKTEELTGNNLEFLLRDKNNVQRRLQSQSFSTPYPSENDPELRKYSPNPRDLTTDWQQMRLAFNSGDVSGDVELWFAMFRGQSGRLWIDDLEVVNEPTINWLVRDDLPVTVRRENGAVLDIGTDIDPIFDPSAGQAGYKGNYATYQTPPDVTLPNGTRVGEGETVYLSGWHTMIAYAGQIGCSWNGDGVHDRIREVHRVLEDKFDPDGYLLNFDEIRQGGWEPTDTAFDSSAEALSASISRAFASMESVTTDADYYFWSDMIDPGHNAKADYLHIKGSLEGAWEGALDPNKVILATWWETYDIAAKGRPSLEFFDGLGFRQVLGAFYDSSVSENYNLWQDASAGVGGIVGNMYATWSQDYSKIEEYGQLWWQNED